MSLIVDSIFTEWRASLPEGSSHPNTKNDYHLFLLKEICLKRGISENIINSVILALEADGEGELSPEEKKKAYDQGLEGKGGSAWGPKGQDKITHRVKGKSLEKLSEPETLDKKGSGGKTGGTGTETPKTSSDTNVKKDVNTLFKDPETNEPDKHFADTGGVVDKEKEEDTPQKKREKTLKKVFDLFIPSGEDTDVGAGKFRVTEEDINDYKAWIALSPEEREAKQKEIVEKQKEKIGEVTDADIDKFIVDLEERLGPKAYKSLMSSIRGKGAPPPKYTTGKFPKGHPKEGQSIGKERERQIIKHYIQTGGINPMNGKSVPFGDAQLDHITSLDNDGEDGAENWMWMEAKINQFKGSLNDKEVEAKLIERGMKTVDELNKEMSEDEMKNWQTQAEIAYWQTRFETNDMANLTEKSIDEMKGPELKTLVKAWNLYVGKGDPRYVARYGVKKVTFKDKIYPLSRDNIMKPDKKDRSSWGLEMQPDGSLKKIKKIKTYDQAMAAYKGDRESGGRGGKGSEIKQGIIKALTGINSPFKDEKGNKISIPSKRDEKVVDGMFEAIEGLKIEKKRDIDDIDRAIKANPRSADNLKKQITKEPKYQQLRAGMKAAIGKGNTKKPDNPEEYNRLKQEYDDWYLSKWKGWMSLIG